MPTTRPILLVEDNPDDVLLTQTAFEEARISNQMVVARDGVEALDYLFCRGAWADRDPAIEPQVILLDLKLPRLDGLDVLKAIRNDRRTESIPVVVLTSSNEEGDIVMGYRLGANSYVRKPVDFAEFLEAAKQLGLYWLVLNRVAAPGY